MVTIVDLGETTLKCGIVEVRCLSTDTKPTAGIKNGSKLIEMDSQDVYYYDAENEEWITTAN